MVIKNEKISTLEMYRKSEGRSKETLHKIFGEKLYLLLWQDFCEESNLKVKLPYPKPKNTDEESDNAHTMLRIIIRIRTNNWIPNWKDVNEKKFYPRFNMGGSSFGFTATLYDFWNACSTAGSHLCYPDEELCIETVREFLPIYKKYFLK